MRCADGQASTGGAGVAVAAAGAGHHPLDNAAWHALTGPHAAMAEVARGARRYPAEVSFFSAVDRLDGEGWADLAALAGPGGIATLSRPAMPSPPAGWLELGCVQAHQMVLSGGLGGSPLDPLDPPGPPPAIRPLTGDDVPAMLALVELAKPGPFMVDTIRFGGYVGVEERGRLVAMAGRRLRLGGFTEISAVCVHPDAARRGLATAVTGHVARTILDEGDTPFLHVAHGNDAARRVYERLGFAVRTTIDFTMFQAPDPATGDA